MEAQHNPPERGKENRETGDSLAETKNIRQQALPNVTSEMENHPRDDSTTSHHAMQAEMAAQATPQNTSTPSTETPSASQELNLLTASDADFAAWIAEFISRVAINAGVLYDQSVMDRLAELGVADMGRWTFLIQQCKLEKKALKGVPIRDWQAKMEKHIAKMQKATKIAEQEANQASDLQVLDRDAPLLLQQGWSAMESRLTALIQKYGAQPVLMYPTTMKLCAAAITAGFKAECQTWQDDLVAAHEGWTARQAKTWMDRFKPSRTKAAQHQWDVLDGTDAVPGSSSPAPLTVGEVWPDAPDADQILPPMYHYRPDGVWKMNEEEEVLLVGPCYVSRWLRDLYALEDHIEITFYNDGTWHCLTAEPASLIDVRSAGKLVNNGLTMVHVKDTLWYLNQILTIIKQTRLADRSTSIAGFHTLESKQEILVLPHDVWATTPMSRAIHYLDVNNAVLSWLKAAQPVQVDMTMNQGFATAQEVWTHVWQLASPNKMALIIGWFWASLWADKLRDFFNGFPVLNVFAIRGTGKTTILREVYTALWGGCEIESATATTFPILRSLAATTTIPVILDEFRIGDLSENREKALYSLLRKVWDGSVEQRGQANQQVRNYPLTTPTILAGESRPADAALLDRLVLTTLTKSETVESPNSASALAWLREHRDDGQQAAGWILQQRLAETWDTAIVKTMVSHNQTFLQRRGGKDLPERALIGLSLVLWGLQWGASLGLIPQNISAVNWQDILVDAQAQRRFDSPADIFVRFLEELWTQNGQTKYGQIPMTVIVPELRVAATAVQGAWDLWSKDHNLPRLGVQNLETELGTVPGLFLERSKVSKIHGKLYRCYVFDVNVLATRYGIDPDFWTEA